MAITNHWFFVLRLFAALGCGLIAGVFFAFSTFVMAALAQRPTTEGIATMQAINITVINPWFMTAFLGTGVACIILTIFSLFQWHQPGAVYLLVGSLLYLVGTIAVTMIFNVPLNDALALVSDLPSAIAKPDSAEGANLWARYLTNWTVWNHVRTIAALVAAALLTLAIGNPAKL